MYNSFQFHIPTAIEYGVGSLSRLPELVKRLGGQRVLVVGDAGVQRAGIVEAVRGTLVNGGYEASVFTNVESDPAVESVEEGLMMSRRDGCDLVVGVGGGSALDTAKAIGLMLTNAGTIRDYVGIDRVPLPAAPVIAIPTTAGTGSELTIWSVLTDRQANAKISIGSVFNCPRIGLLDPALTVSLPPNVTAATGMDALTHAVESFVNKASQPISAALAQQAIELIGRSLVPAVRDGGDLAARGDMLVASAMAGMAFNMTRLGLVHALGLPLGNAFHIPHGLVNGIMLPAVMSFNVPANPHGYARVAALLGVSIHGYSMEEAARASIEAVMSLKDEIGMTQTLADFGVEECHFDALIEEAMKSGNVAVNPRMPTHEDMGDLLRCGIRGTVLH